MFRQSIILNGCFLASLLPSTLAQAASSTFSLYVLETKPCDEPLPTIRASVISYNSADSLATLLLNCERGRGTFHPCSVMHDATVTVGPRMMAFNVEEPRTTESGTISVKDNTTTISFSEHYMTASASCSFSSSRTDAFDDCTGYVTPHLTHWTIVVLPETWTAIYEQYVGSTRNLAWGFGGHVPVTITGGVENLPVASTTTALTTTSSSGGGAAAAGLPRVTGYVQVGYAAAAAAMGAGVGLAGVM
ncbi:hypothetical protein QBC35DRAFT_466883 [Podospora australis]|uniref:Uncharacterized protein n=1 Tax=Podospora australis TaxID=1536484 RepID=A0AAN6WKX5_9PEZI|nr:hypothetical protein QBC35DRAFT_466883 [Podospora australis]